MPPTHFYGVTSQCDSESDRTRRSVIGQQQARGVVTSDSALWIERRGSVMADSNVVFYPLQMTAQIAVNCLAEDETFSKIYEVFVSWQERSFILVFHNGRKKKARSRFIQKCSFFKKEFVFFVLFEVLLAAIGD